MPDVQVGKGYDTFGSRFFGDCKVKDRSKFQFGTATNSKVLDHASVSYTNLDDATIEASNVSSADSLNPRLSLTTVARVNFPTAKGSRNA